MADEWIKVGQTFTVTLDTTPLVTLTSYSGHLIYYKRPDGKTGTITPDSVGLTSMVGTVSTTLNPLTGTPGVWEFYPYCINGSIILRGKEDFVEVHPQFRNPN